MAEFKIVEKAQKSDHTANLPDPDAFAADLQSQGKQPAGIEAVFPDGKTYVLTAPRGWSWQPKRGRALGSKNGESKPAESKPESKPESK